MKEKKRLLILGFWQFGYTTAVFKHCEFSRDEFDITYLGWDYEDPKIELPGIKVLYVSRKSNIIVRNLRLLHKAHKEIQKGYDIVFANYIKGISLVRLLNPKTKFILYVITMGVTYSKLKRWLFDTMVKLELRAFKNIVLINSGLAKKLRVNKYDILTMGGNCFSKKEKSFDKLSLLYVGTLGNRNVINCVKGFHRFITENNALKEDETSRFVIVGDTLQNELKEIRQYVKENKLENYIFTPGFIHQEGLYPYFEEANIGVAYVPITPYFQNQPPTKTYEYLVSGLPVIATATAANSEIVLPVAGELVKDNAESFYEGLKKMNQRKSEFTSEKIKKLYSEDTWERMVRTKFIPLIHKYAD
ncbi:glycosyltransferase [Maribacter halichondriae]|uniref:glycosyltransferase n=1 Tax=Maribacter halichondriae TaxID=2980554 RepID=UPI0023582E3F|nr:glycosyltransferase [Maribacter sp. Hal144]